MQRFLDVIRDGDTTGFLDLFTEQGEVDDWGRTFTGRRQIRAWSDEEFIGAHGHLSEVTIGTTGPSAAVATAVVTVVAQWTSQRHTGPSRFVLHVEGHHLRSMTITAA